MTEYVLDKKPVINCFVITYICRRFTSFVFLCMMLVSLSCTLHYKAINNVDGVEIAILKNGDSAIRLKKIDGKGPDDYGMNYFARLSGDDFGSRFNSSFEVEISPGWHTLETSFVESWLGGEGIMYGKRLNISFLARPGHVYSIKHVVEREYDRWHPEVWDIKDPDCTRRVSIGHRNY